MKKKIMAMMTAMVLVITMLAGCGGPTKKDYESDMNVLTQAADFIDQTDFDSGDSFTDKLKGLSCKTEEGKLLLADYISMGSIYDEMKTEMAKDEYDSDAINKLMDKMTALQETFNTHLEAFADAAKAKGVDASQFESSAETN